MCPELPYPTEEVLDAVDASGSIPLAEYIYLHVGKHLEQLDARKTK